MAHPLNDNERLLVRRAYDKLELCEKRYSPASLGFLNELEQDILLNEFENIDGCKAVFFGGYENADRRALVFVPEYCEFDPNELFAAIRCSYYKDYQLTHRDFLGALMGLSIEREMIGDIIVSKNGCYADIVVKREMLSFILSDFTSAGRATLKLEQIPFSYLDTVDTETEIITDTVATPRLDAVASIGFGMSRENASALVKSGKVFLNRRCVSSPDKAVSDGALINASGYGKFKVFIDGKLSKKGRMFVKIEKYV